MRCAAPSVAVPVKSVAETALVMIPNRAPAAATRLSAPSRPCAAPMEDAPLARLHLFSVVINVAIRQQVKHVAAAHRAVIIPLRKTAVPRGSRFAIFRAARRAKLAAMTFASTPTRVVVEPMLVRSQAPVVEKSAVDPTRIVRSAPALAAPSEVYSPRSLAENRK